MRAAETARLLDMELLLPELAEQDMEITGCYIGDLLSNVMGQASQGQLWLTVMTNINVIAVAQLLGLAGIVFLEGNRGPQEVMARARQEGIPVFATTASAYEAAWRFHQTLAAKQP